MPDQPVLQWWEPSEWLVAFGVHDSATFLAAARGQGLIVAELYDGDADEFLVETLTVRQVEDPAFDPDPCWEPCAPDAPGATRITIWRG